MAGQFVAQIYVPFMIPSMAHYFAIVREQFPAMKMGGTVCSVGNELNKHFQACGQIVARLEKDGWKVIGYADGCNAQHPDVTTTEQADLRLKAVGINPSHVFISSTWDNWFKDDEVKLLLENPPKSIAIN
jgi:hypothetical protein